MLGRAGGEEVELADVAGELPERPLAGERERRAAGQLLALLVGVVGDVLAQALLAGAAQVVRRRDARELGRRRRARGLRASSPRW